MARRRKDNSFVGIMLELPWWASLIVAVILWGIAKFKFGDAAQIDASDPGSYINYAALYLFKIFAALALFASVVSGIRVVFRRLLFASAKDLDAIRNMSWQNFERLVGEAYRMQGYRVRESGGGGADGGVDLWLSCDGQITLVQCKQWRSSKVGVQVVREMYGIMTAEKADGVIIATVGEYTKDAAEFARGKPIELLTGKRLVKLINSSDRGVTEPRSQSTELEASSVAIMESQEPSGTAYESQDYDEIEIEVPVCGKCGIEMVLRTARKGANAGNQFWGCANYPKCREMKPLYQE